MRFRRRKRCPNRTTTGERAGLRCEKDAGHDGMCTVNVGRYKHYWMGRTVK